MRRSDAVGKDVQFCLCLLLFVDDDGVVEVAASNEAGSQHHFHFTNEAECAGRGYLGAEEAYVAQLCGLVVKHFAGEGDSDVKAEMVAGLYAHYGTGLLV